MEGFPDHLRAPRRLWGETPSWYQANRRVGPEHFANEQLKRGFGLDDMELEYAYSKIRDMRSSISQEAHMIPRHKVGRSQPAAYNPTRDDAIRLVEGCSLFRYAEPEWAIDNIVAWLNYEWTVPSWPMPTTVSSVPRESIASDRIDAASIARHTPTSSCTTQYCPEEAAIDTATISSATQTSSSKRNEPSPISEQVPLKAPETSSLPLIKGPFKRDVVLPHLRLSILDGYKTDWQNVGTLVPQTFADANGIPSFEKLKASLKEQPHFSRPDRHSFGTSGQEISGFYVWPGFEYNVKINSQSAWLSRMAALTWEGHKWVHLSIEQGRNGLIISGDFPPLPYGG